MSLVHYISLCGMTIHSNIPNGVLNAIFHISAGCTSIDHMCPGSQYILRYRLGLFVKGFDLDMTEECGPQLYCRSRYNSYVLLEA